MNKDIQNNRTKKYFIDAVKDIIIIEGVENVSVRRLGAITGYSYATMYNYFHGVDHLLWHVGVDFIQDILSLFQDEINKESYTLEDIQKNIKKYIGYYFENPNVFKFFFFYQIQEPPDAVDRNSKRPGIEEFQLKILEKWFQQVSIKEEIISLISGLIMNSIHGMLLMYFSKKRTISEQDIYNRTDEVLQFLLEKQYDTYKII